MGTEVPRGPSDYKEIAAGMKAYKHENELNGVGDFAPASYPKYLPQWDPGAK